MTFNIYVPSYKRFNCIKTANLVEYCTYVVRKSEEQAYRDAGIENVLAVEDELINSVNKVKTWIMEHTEEDVVCILDDDIKCFKHRHEDMEDLSKESATRELERLAQMICDLEIGYCGCPNGGMQLKYYDQPFKFSGVTIALCIINKACSKAKLNPDLKFLSDVDYVLQELLGNRIILVPNYFVVDAEVDTNEGGSNESKSLAEFEAENEIVKNKWGKYYIKADGGSAGRISVKR